MNKQTIADQYRTDPVKACRRALHQTINLPENDRLEAINILLETCGTEAIRGEWQNGYWGDIVAAYCNTGDSYAVTVLQVRSNSSYRASRFIVAAVGDWAEKNERRFSLR